MPSYRGHITGYLICVGLVVWAVIVGRNYLIPLSTWILGFLIGFLYTLLPDLDHPSSKIRKLGSIIIILVALVSLVGYLLVENFYLVGILVGCLVFLLFLWTRKHRGIMHRWWFGVLVSVPVFVYSFWIGVFALGGYFLHLVLDNMQKD